MIVLPPTLDKRLDIVWYELQTKLFVTQDSQIELDTKCVEALEALEAIVKDISLADENRYPDF